MNAFSCMYEVIHAGLELGTWAVDKSLLPGLGLGVWASDQGEAAAYPAISLHEWPSRPGQDTAPDLATCCHLIGPL